jgi:dTDP-4-amino-4,6-dideoxygalactose transaminase
MYYLLLHSSPFGRSVGRCAGDMTNTDAASDRLVRLPLWLGLEDHLPAVISEVLAAVAPA